MRIALTADPEIPVPPVHYGGIERIVDMLARGLAARGHHVTLFAHPDSKSPSDFIAWPGRSSQSSADTFRNAVTLTGAVMRGEVDLVHSFSRIAYLTAILPLSVPKVMSYQRAINPKMVGWGNALARGTLNFTAISRWMMCPVEHIGQWTMIPNGVPLASYTFRADVAPDAPLVFLGRIEEIKGPHLAIEVARRTGRQLVIAGNIPSEKRNWAEAHVFPHVDGHRIRYIGPVDDAQKNELLGKAAAFLMPILWEEPFGIVMAEAMACGTPVIGLRRGSVPEVVEDGITGYVVDDLEGLINAVARIPTLDRAASRLRVETLYSDEAIVDAYEMLYANCIRHCTQKQ
jgi:glycosyltransferase involved in cell wall biosynthesis